MRNTTGQHDATPRTPAQRRRSADRVVFDAFMATCPTRQVFATIADKWAGLTIAALRNGPLRHGQLMTVINGASQKMLTQTLRTLERDGLVLRTVTPTVPLRVDYELTPLGHSLLDPIKHLKAWAEDYVPEVREAQEAYDREAAS